MDVDRVRRVGAGDDQAAGFHDLDDHFAAAAARIAAASGLRRRRLRRDLALNPLRIEREARIVFERGILLEQLPRTAAGDHGAQNAPAPAEQLHDVLVGGLQRRLLRRVAAPAGRRHVLRIVHADERSGIDFVRGHRHADAVGELDHAFLLHVGQAHVAFDQIVLEHLRALQFHFELRGVRNGDAHLVVDAVPLHQVASAVHAGARTHARLVGLAILDGFVRRVARAAHRGDAERQPRASLGGAEILLQVRVELRQARHHGQIGRIDDLRLEMVGRRVGHHGRDLVARHDHIDIRSHGRRLHVEELARVDDDPRFRNGRRPRHVERDRLRLAALDVDDAELIERLIQDVPRVALPARGMRALGGDASRRPDRLAGRRHRPDRQHSLVDRRHLHAVRRPHRPAAAARVDGQQRNRRVPLHVAARRGDRLDLVGAFAEAHGHRPDAGERDALAVGRPRRRARLRQRVVDPRDAAVLEIEDRHFGDAPHAVHVEEHDPPAVGRKRRALRLRGDVGDLAAHAALHVANPQLQVRALAIGRIHERRAIRRPRRIGVERHVLGEVHGRAAGHRHHVNVAERRKGDLRAVRRDHRAHEAERLARRRRREIPHARFVFRVDHVHRRGELEGLHRQPGHRAAANLAVRDVEVFRSRRPRRAEGEDVLAAGHRLAVDLVAGLPGGGSVIQQLAARSP